MKTTILSLPSSDPTVSLVAALERIRLLEVELRKLQPTLSQRDNAIRVFHLGRLIRISLSRILYFKAESNYTWIYLIDGQQYYVSRTLKSLIDEIRDSDFVRCHRSYLINRKEVEEINRTSGEIRLTSGITVPSSRRFLRTSTKSIFSFSHHPSNTTTAKPDCAVHKLTINGSMRCN